MGVPIGFDEGEIKRAVKLARRRGAGLLAHQSACLQEKQTVASIDRGIPLPEDRKD